MMKKIEEKGRTGERENFFYLFSPSLSPFPHFPLSPLKNLLITLLVFTQILFPIAIPLAVSREGRDTEPPLIRQLPPTDAYTGMDLPIVSTIEDAGSITGVTLFYRKKGDEIYSHTAMSLVSGNIYRAVIPSVRVSLEGMEYYIEAIDEHKNLSSDGVSVTPYLVEITFLAQSSESFCENDKGERRFYCKWWFWTIIAGVGGGGYALSSPGEESSSSSSGGSPGDTGDVTGTW